METLQHLFSVIVSADAWYIAGSPLLDHIANRSEPIGNPENEVLCFTWFSFVEGTEFSESITEEDLANATVKGNTITIIDPEGDFDIQLFRLTPVEINLAPTFTE
jgi:hypothetical protein